MEINDTFYRMPKREVFESWAEQVPDTFRFSVKASRRITRGFCTVASVGTAMGPSPPAM